MRRDISAKVTRIPMRVPIPSTKKTPPRFCKSSGVDVLVRCYKNLDFFMKTLSRLLKLTSQLPAPRSSFHHFILRSAIRPLS